MPSPLDDPRDRARRVHKMSSPDSGSITSPSRMLMQMPPLSPSLDDGASRVHKFLRRQNEAPANAAQEAQVVVELTRLLKAVLRNTVDTVLLSIVQDFGWDVDGECFDEEDLVDLRGLQVALSEKSRCFFSAQGYIDVLDKSNRTPGRATPVRKISQAFRTKTSAHCFVPQLLLDHVTKRVRRGSRYLRPHSAFLQGVCLLVDISGFTKLSAAFCAQGRAGVDGLRHATNKCMTRLVETIYAYEGTHTHIHTHIYIHLYTSIYIYIYTHLYTYT
jgi:hypothetical protein